MKPFFLIALIFFAFACNQKKVADATKKPKRLSDWKIDNTTAVKLIDYLTSCTKDCQDATSITAANLPVLNELRSTYPRTKIISVPARYKDETDSERYRKLRYLTKPEEFAVMNHRTILYMVPADGTNGLEQDEYYDAVTICPPPNPCREKLDTLLH